MDNAVFCLSHSSLDGYVGCFHLLTDVNNAATNKGVQKSEFLLLILLGIYAEAELLFNFLRNRHTVFHNVAPFYVLARLTTSPYPCQHILFCFYVIVILIGEKWYLIVVWFAFPQWSSNVEHLFICLLAIHISFLKKCLFKSFASFNIGGVVVKHSYLPNPLPILYSGSSVVYFYF